MRLAPRLSPLSILAIALCACGALSLPEVEPAPELRDPLSVESVVLAEDRQSVAFELDEPFAGSVVRDLGGHVIFLQAPAGLAQIGGLPGGWELIREGNVLGGAAPRWERVWSHGDSMVTLIQAFDGPVDTTGDERQPDVAINGEAATFYLHRPTGEMVMTWPLGGDEVALVGYLTDFSRAEFIDLAESVSLPPD